MVFEKWNMVNLIRKTIPLTRHSLGSRTIAKGNCSLGGFCHAQTIRFTDTLVFHLCKIVIR